MLVKYNNDNAAQTAASNPIPSPRYDESAIKAVTVLRLTVTKIIGKRA